MKNKPRTKSAEETVNETEFYRRRNLKGCEVRYLDGGPRSFTTVLMGQGIELGTKTEISSRGKVTSVLYTLPSLDCYEAIMALPLSPKGHGP